MTASANEVLEELLAELAEIHGRPLDAMTMHNCEAAVGCPRCVRDRVYAATAMARNRLARIRLGVVGGMSRPDLNRPLEEAWAERDKLREEVERLRAEIRQGAEALRPFGGGDLLTGVKQIQSSLEFEIDEHQRHHDSESLLIAERDRLRAVLADEDLVGRELIANNGAIINFRYRDVARAILTAQWAKAGLP
jgi:hypothetical protein